MHDRPAGGTGCVRGRDIDGGRADGPAPDSADGSDATSRLGAYGTGCTSQSTAPDAPQDPNAGYDTCRALQVLDVVTGKLISFPAPPGTAGWVPDGFNRVSAILATAR